MLKSAGIFIPSLAVGAAWGRVIGMVINSLLIAAGVNNRVSLPAYAVRPLLQVRHSGTAASLKARLQQCIQWAPCYTLDTCWPQGDCQTVSEAHS